MFIVYVLFGLGMILGIPPWGILHRKGIFFQIFGLGIVIIAGLIIVMNKLV